MYSWGPLVEKIHRAVLFKELRIAVTFPRPGGLPGPIRSGIPLTLRNVNDFVPEKQKMDQGIDELRKLGFILSSQGKLTASMKCTKEAFERAFNTELKQFRLDTKENYSFYSFYLPAKRAPWRPLPILQGLIDGAHIQWPHIYMAPVPSVKPPKVNYYHLNVPKGVVDRLNATQLHAKGVTGKDIRVAMIDSGFAHESHPFFAANGYKSTVFLAGDAVDKTKDLLGHGTGESANFFSIAPHADFIGIKIASDDLAEMLNASPASMLDGFITARNQNPHIISISIASDLRDPKSTEQCSQLREDLIAVQAEILHAVGSGITVVAAAGNGQFGFPGMMPDVISVGGVYVAQKDKMQASDWASAFESKIYPGRHVPDVCGLVGLKRDRYIMLPVQPGCIMDLLVSAGDQTKSDDGWAAFSGTSAAAPQVAGVCALLKAQNPGLTPSDTKAVLRRTAKSVKRGHSNKDSSDDGRTPLPAAGLGEDGATGAGLVDAFRAWKQV